MGSNHQHVLREFFPLSRMPPPGAVCPAIVRNGFADIKAAQKVNRAPHAKDTGARARSQDARAQTAGAGIIEVGDFYYLSTASAHGSRPAALRAREGRHGGTRERGRECKKAKYNEAM